MRCVTYPVSDLPELVSTLTPSSPALPMPAELDARHKELVLVTFEIAPGGRTIPVLSRAAHLRDGRRMIVFDSQEWNRLLQFIGARDGPPSVPKDDPILDEWISDIGDESRAVLAELNAPTTPTNLIALRPDPLEAVPSAAELRDSNVAAPSPAAATPKKAPPVMADPFETPREGRGARAASPPLLDAPDAADRSDRPKTLAPHGAPAADDDLVGTIIGGKYVVEGLLGKGAMGSVYRGRVLALDKSVAIKILHPKLATEPRFRRRFEREAKAASRLDHPNCVRVQDFGMTADGIFYFIMDYIRGSDLARLLKNGPLGTYRTAQIVSQILAALSAAHDVGIIHRDLKPENVVVLPGKDDEGYPIDIVKVCDFGIAKLVEQENGGEGAAKSSEHGILIGTPEYMSPEQAQGDPVDARSDIYSVGVVLYFMLTKSLPFSADSPIRTILLHVTQAPKRPSEINPEVNRTLESVCLKALQKDPADRYPSARLMRSHVRSVLPNDWSESTQPRKMPWSAHRLGARAKALGLGVGAAAVAAVFGGFLALRGVVSMSPTQAPAKQLPAANAPLSQATITSGNLASASPSAERAAALSPAPAPAKGFGRLVFISERGPCRAIVDGAPRGTLPLPSLDLPVGEHELRCEFERGPDEIHRINLTEGATASVVF